MNDDDRFEHRNSDSSEPETAGRGRHRWVMIACCLPILVIAAALVLTGSVTTAGLLFVLACMAMMAIMMFSPPGRQH